MAGKDIIEMRLRELKRLKVVQLAVDKQVTQRAVASMLGLSERQIRRLVRSVRESGEVGIIHKGRGCPSNRRMPDEVREKAIMLYRGKYHDFGPTLASEKLLELDGIGVSNETLADWGGSLAQEAQQGGSQAMERAEGMFWRNGSDGRQPSLLT